MSHKLKLKSRDRVTGRTARVTDERGVELFIGGIAGLMNLADGLALPASTGGALVLALDSALPKLAKVSVKGIVKAYHQIGHELPTVAGAKVLAATVKPKSPRRRRRR